MTRIDNPLAIIDSTWKNDKEVQDQGKEKKNNKNRDL